MYTPTYSFYMDIGDRLDKAMKSAGYKSQMDLSRDSGVPQPTISRILSKKGIPETETVQKLAKVCRVSFEWLMSGKDVVLTNNIHSLKHETKEENDNYWPFTLTKDEFKRFDDIQIIAIDEAILSLVNRWKKAKTIKKSNNK